MIRRRSSHAVACLGLFVLLSGCTAPTADDGMHDAEGVMFRDHPGLGPILTDGQGRTLYVFTNDEPGVSKCYDQCAVNWPPYVVNATPDAPVSIRSALDLVERTDGTSQLAYRERPLYYWLNDQAPGQATGDGVGGVWFVVRQPPTNSAILEGAGAVEAVGENVTYSNGTTGYYAHPEGTNATAGVVMIHEWWGLKQEIRDMADLLATHGYQVLAVDLFKGSVAGTQQEAQAQVGALDQEEANGNMRDAANFLRARGAQEIVSLGWCFGGGQSLQMALSGETLAATVIYYGFLTSDEAKLAQIEWPVLGIFGEADQAIPVAQVRSFERALNNVTVENDIFIYPDVGHAFANPSGEAWAPDETKDAWERTLAFLEAHAPV